MSRFRRILATAIISTGPALSGCGLYTPNMPDFGDPPYAEEGIENLVVNQIKCQIHRGVQDVLYDPRFYPPIPGITGKSVEWLRRWGAKVSYVLTAVEKSSLNPGATVTEPFSKMGSFFSLGIGLQSSAEAKRQETGAVTYSFADLLKEGPKPCTDNKGVLIYSDLKIEEFISSKVFLTRVPGTIPDMPVSLDDKPQVLTAASEELTFTIAYSGGITPSWKFVRLSVNSGSPLFNVTRTKTQYVTITLGPIKEPSTPTAAAQLTPEAQTLDAANLIGHAITTSLVSVQP